MRDGTGKRYYYHLVGPDGRVYGSAGQRWILEGDLERGRCQNTDDNDELVELPLPAGCRIEEVTEAQLQ